MNWWLLKVHINTNFAVGPSINGKKFQNPVEPFSTNGQAATTPCTDENVFCTNTVKVPLGTIVELSITSLGLEAKKITGISRKINLNPKKAIIYGRQRTFIIWCIFTAWNFLLCLPDMEVILIISTLLLHALMVIITPTLAGGLCEDHIP